MYYYNDAYLLPFSHDETVHGKATILQKMYGEYDDKFPQARALYLYMYAHPEKKLNFMGNELGQLREWDEKREQDWEILKYPLHDAFHRFMKDLNQIYLNHPALYGQDYVSDGFQWLDCHQEERCVYAFERSCGLERIVAVFNFSDEVQEDYLLTVKNAHTLKLLIDSDMDLYAGEKHDTGEKITLENKTAMLTLNAYSGVYYLIE